MGAVYFYHLTRRPLEATLPVLLERSLAQGWRVMVRGPQPERLDWLDQKLWLLGDDGFLPHGRAGGPHDADQPVLLTEAASGIVNGAHCVMSIDGAEIATDEISAADRACILFDGHDQAAVAHARTQWKALTEAGCEAQYWSEEGGRWELKASANDS